MVGQPLRFRSVDLRLQKEIKGPDNPTYHLLWIMSNKCCSGTRKKGKTKEVVKDREVNKNGVGQSCMWKMVCDKETWCVTKLCVKDGVVKIPGCPKVVGSILGPQQVMGKWHRIPTRCYHGAKRGRSAPPKPAQCHKCHACHAECTSERHFKIKKTATKARLWPLRGNNLCAFPRGHGGTAWHGAGARCVLHKFLYPTKSKCPWIPANNWRWAYSLRRGGLRGSRILPLPPPRTKVWSLKGVLKGGLKGELTGGLKGTSKGS